MSNLKIVCPCGQVGTYFGAYAVRGSMRPSQEHSVIIWRDPKVEKVEDLKLTVQWNIEVPVYRCLLCSLNRAGVAEKEREEREQARLERKKAKAEARAAHPPWFTRLFGGKEKS